MQSDEGLIIAGIVLLGVGYIPAVVVGAITVSDGGWLGFIPVVGGFIWPAQSLLGFAMGLPTATLQTAGLIVLLVGVVTRNPVSRALLDPSLVPGPGELGAGLRWRF